MSTLLSMIYTMTYTFICLSVCHFLSQVKPPLVPPKGEVNAADAFDIGSFDSDETRGVRVSENTSLHMYST